MNLEKNMAQDDVQKVIFVLECYTWCGICPGCVCVCAHAKGIGSGGWGQCYIRS